MVAVRLCRPQRGDSLGTAARGWGGLVLSALGSNNRGLAQRNPYQDRASAPATVLLFFPASELEDLWPIDQKTARKLMQSAHASLTEASTATTQSGEQYGKCRTTQSVGEVLH